MRGAQKRNNALTDTSWSRITVLLVGPVASVQQPATPRQRRPSRISLARARVLMLMLLTMMTIAPPGAASSSLLFLPNLIFFEHADEQTEIH
jgi:hypothetical protein